MPTIFMDAAEFGKLDLDYLISKGLKFKQLYISDHGNVISLKDNITIEKLCRNYKVTVERTYVPTIVQTTAEIMLVVEHDSVWNLRKQDQIKFSRNLNVLSFPVKEMVETIPEDFARDITL